MCIFVQAYVYHSPDWVSMSLKKGTLLKADTLTIQHQLSTKEKQNQQRLLRYSSCPPVVMVVNEHAKPSKQLRVIILLN